MQNIPCSHHSAAYFYYDYAKEVFIMLYEDTAFVSVGAFGTQENWIHPVRKSPLNELIAVTEGTLHICEDYNEFHVEAGNVLFLKPNREHYGTIPSEGGVSFVRVSFSGSFEGKDGQQLFIPADTEQVSLLLHQLRRFDDTAEYPRDCGDYLLRLLLCELFLFGSAGDAGNLPARIAAYIRSGNGALRVRDVAEHFDYNEDYITRVFKRVYTRGIKAYIDTVRVRRIKQYLSETDESLHEIARKTGFEDYASLYSFFKYKTGMTLSAYRALYRSEDTDGQEDK